MELLGFDNLSFVTTLLIKRLTIVENINRESQYQEIPPVSLSKLNPILNILLILEFLQDLQETAPQQPLESNSPALLTQLTYI